MMRPQRGFITLPAFTPLDWVLVGMGVLCLALTAWALLERSGRLAAKVEVVRLEAQVAVLSAAVERQNEGIEATRIAGKAAQDGVRELLAAASRLSGAGTRLGTTIEEARRIVATAAPRRADGTAVDCTDAWREIETRAKP